VEDIPLLLFLLHYNYKKRKREKEKKRKRKNNNNKRKKKKKRRKKKKKREKKEDTSQTVRCVFEGWKNGMQGGVRGRVEEERGVTYAGASACLYVTCHVSGSVFMGTWTTLVLWGGKCVVSVPIVHVTAIFSLLPRST
jgi:hypothetical protein